MLSQGRKRPAVAGPIQVITPELMFMIDMAAPRDSGALAIMAAIGANPASAVPQSPGVIRRRHALRP